MANEALYQSIIKKLGLVRFTMIPCAEKTTYYTHLANSKNLANDKVCETLKFMRMKLLSSKSLTTYQTVCGCYIDKFRLLIRWRTSKNRTLKINNKRTKQSIKQKIADVKSQLILFVQLRVFFIVNISETPNLRLIRVIFGGVWEVRDKCKYCQKAKKDTSINVLYSNVSSEKSK